MLLKNYAILQLNLAVIKENITVKENYKEKCRFPTTHSLY